MHKLLSESTLMLRKFHTPKRSISSQRELMDDREFNQAPACRGIAEENQCRHPWLNSKIDAPFVASISRVEQR